MQISLVFKLDLEGGRSGSYLDEVIDIRMFGASAFGRHVTLKHLFEEFIASIIIDIARAFGIDFDDSIEQLSFLGFLTGR